MTEFLGDWTFSSQLPMVQLFGGAPHLAREYTFDLLTICFRFGVFLSICNSPFSPFWKWLIQISLSLSHQSGTP